MVCFLTASDKFSINGNDIFKINLSLKVNLEENIK